MNEAQGASDLSLETWGVWRKVGGQSGARGGVGGGRALEREETTQ